MSDRELIERLRARAFRLATRDFNGDGAKLAKEAADLLESQEAEIERVLAANKDCLLHFDVMKAENESLREALENALASGVPAPVADALLAARQKGGEA